MKRVSDERLVIEAMLLIYAFKTSAYMESTAGLCKLG